MDRNKLKEIWIAEENKCFEGWDFSYINNRIFEEPLLWNYDKLVRQHKKPDSVLLDMGTGGGEYLLTLGHPYHKTYATEAYLPNFELCQKRLAPLGITIKQVVSDSSLPFESEMFDILLNRHESFDIAEVYRLLKPGGNFLTQQVGGLNNRELSNFLLGEHKEIVSSKHNLENNLELFKNRGFSILNSNEFFPKLKFFDIGALVYFAKIIEWEFPGFSVEGCFDKLCQLQRIVEKQGYVESTEHRFVIVAQKPI